jgi:hypothetical protein
MKREFVGGPMDGTKVPVDEDEEVLDEIHVDIIDERLNNLVHVYTEDEETGNYQYQGQFKRNELEEDEDE